MVENGLILLEDLKFVVLTMAFLALIILYFLACKFVELCRSLRNSITNNRVRASEEPHDVIIIHERLEDPQTTKSISSPIVGKKDINSTPPQLELCRNTEQTEKKQSFSSQSVQPLAILQPADNFSCSKNLQGISLVEDDRSIKIFPLGQRPGSNESSPTVSNRDLFASTGSERAVNSLDASTTIADPKRCEQISTVKEIVKDISDPKCQSTLMDDHRIPALPPKGKDTISPAVAVPGSSNSAGLSLSTQSESLSSTSISGTSPAVTPTKSVNNTCASNAEARIPPPPVEEISLVDKEVLLARSVAKTPPINATTALPKASNSDAPAAVAPSCEAAKSSKSNEVQAPPNSSNNAGPPLWKRYKTLTMNSLLL